MQLYMGEFRQRCYDPLSNTFPEADGVLCLPDDALLLGGAPLYEYIHTTHVIVSQSLPHS